MTKAHWTLLLWVLAVVASVLLAVRMKPQTSIEGLLDPTDPSVAAMSRVLEHFPATEELLVLASLPDGSSDAQLLLTFAERLEAACKGSTLVSDVRFRAGEQMQGFVRNVVVPAGLDYLGETERQELMARLTPQGMAQQLQRSREAIAAPGPAAGEVAKQLARDPLRLYEFLLARQGQFALPGQGRGDVFYSPSGRDVLIRISGTRPPSDLNFCRQITTEVSSIAAECNRDGLALRISGAYAIAAWNAGKIRSDAIWGTNSSIVAVVLMFVVLYRKPLVQSLLALVPVVFGLALGFGIYALFEAELTPLSAVVGGALGGIGIDYSIHFLAHYRQERAVAASAAVAVRQTLAHARAPMVAAWLTSVIGFAAIALSPVRLLRDFAFLGSLALLGVFLATMTLLPALLLLTDRFNGGAQMRGAALTRVLGAGMARSPRRWLVGSLLVAAAMLVITLLGLGRVGLASDLSILHPRPNPPLDAQREIADRMGMAGGSVFIHLEADSPDELLRRAHQLDRTLATEAVRTAGVVSRFGLASLLPDPAALPADRPDVLQVRKDFQTQLRAAGFNPAKFAAYETFLERLLSPAEKPGANALLQYPEMARLVLSRGALAGDGVTEAITLVFFDRPLDERATRSLAVDTLRAAAATVPGATVTGLSPISMDVDAAIRRDLPRLVALAVALITLYLALHLRSLLLAGLVITPTLVSFIAVFAWMEMAGQSWNLVNIVMLPLLLGINVDYGIFAAAAWNGARGRGELLRRFRAGVPGVLVCCLTTVLGFGSLVSTSIPAVRSLGSLIIVGIVTCLAATVCLVWPAMFLAKTRGRAGAHTSEVR